MKTLRQDDARGLMIKNDVDALLLTDYYSIAYATGFRGLSPAEREAWVILTKDDIHLWSDGRYMDEAFADRARANGVRAHCISPEDGLLKQMERIFSRVLRLGFEAEDLTWSEHQYFGRVPAFRLVPLSHPLMGLREEKNKDEFASIREACKATDRCLKDVIPSVHPGQTEREISYALTDWIRANGYQTAFSPIVAAGVHTAIAHYDTDNGAGVLQKNDLLLIDFGVACDGYNADITRMFVAGEVGPEMRETYAGLREVQQRVVSHLSPGDAYRAIDAECRTGLVRLGHPTYPHSTGHGIGLAVHEYPKVAGTSKERVLEGHVFTIEPGIYHPGRWGMRLEDTVAAIDGKVEVLTAASRDLVRL